MAECRVKTNRCEGALATLAGLIARMEEMVMENRPLTMEQIAVNVNIFNRSVHTILHDNLKMQMVSSNVDQFKLCFTLYTVSDNVIT